MDRFVARIPTLQEARELLHEFTKSPNLRRHAEAVGAAMRAYASKVSPGDGDRWEVIGLLHDFDYERYPSLDAHPFMGAKVLRERGISEEVIKDIFAHAPHTGQPRDTPLRKAIFACDELAGFIVAVALIQPRQTLQEVTTERVVKKLKSKGFAANVSRADIEQGAQELGVPLAEHVGTVLGSLQGIAGALGL